VKGPYQRLKFDLRRVWECPACHHKERTDGTVTAVFCKCQQQNQDTAPVAMKLTEDGPRRAQ